MCLVAIDCYCILFDRVVAYELNSNNELLLDIYVLLLLRSLLPVIDDIHSFRSGWLCITYCLSAPPKLWLICSDTICKCIARKRKAIFRLLYIYIYMYVLRLLWCIYTQFYYIFVKCALFGWKLHVKYHISNTRLYDCIDAFMIAWIVIQSYVAVLLSVLPTYRRIKYAALIYNIYRWRWCTYIALNASPRCFAIRHIYPIISHKFVIKFEQNRSIFTLSMYLLYLYYK